jgi:poly-D-alanine transfer protein DltD
MTMLYGSSKYEKFAVENEFCRQIVKEINNVGVTQRQMLMIVYLISLELEDVEKMQILTQTLRELGKDELFIVPPVECSD